MSTLYGVVNGFWGCIDSANFVVQSICQLSGVGEGCCTGWKDVMMFVTGFHVRW